MMYDFSSTESAGNDKFIKRGNDFLGLDTRYNPVLIRRNIVKIKLLTVPIWILR